MLDAVLKAVREALGSSLLVWEVAFSEDGTGIIRDTYTDAKSLIASNVAGVRMREACGGVAARRERWRCGATARAARRHPQCSRASGTVSE